MSSRVCLTDDFLAFSVPTTFICREVVEISYLHDHYRIGKIDRWLKYLSWPSCCHSFKRNQLALTYFGCFPHYFAYYLFDFSGCRLIWEYIPGCCTEWIHWKAKLSGNHSWRFNRCSIAPASSLGFPTIITVTCFLMSMAPHFLLHTY